MKKDYIYFAAQGITSTSANHIANMSKEYYQTLESELHNIRFYNTSMSLIGTNGSTNLSRGKNHSFLSQIEDKLTQIANAKSLIAWLREAIKAKNNLLKEIRTMTLEDYCALKSIEYPIEPKMETPLDEDTYLANLSIKDRNRMCELQTICAVIGSYIHPDGYYAEARKDLKNKIQNPNKVEGNGRDTLLYSFTPTVLTEEVDNTFFALQAKHREYQAELNGYVHSLQQAIDKDTFEKNTAYTQQLLEYSTKVSVLQSEMKDYLEKEQSRISNLKITIPNSLMSIYIDIKNLSK